VECDKTERAFEFSAESRFAMGAILSLAEIAYSTFITYVIARPIADSFFNVIFAKKHIFDHERSIVRFITNEFFSVIGCFLLAGFVALALWTYKEQRYYAAITSEVKQN
jgi:hypothetical protein